MADVKKCSICDKNYTEWGNNAAPFEGRCCDDCNFHLVIPARLKNKMALKALYLHHKLIMKEKV